MPEPGSCSRCGERVVGTGRPYYEEVTGWVQRRSQGGANQVTARQPTGRFMCEPCMHIEKLDAPDTAAMF